MIIAKYFSLEYKQILNRTKLHVPNSKNWLSTADWMNSVYDNQRFLMSISEYSSDHWFQNLFICVNVIR